jgi:hypothetical protein
VGVGRRALVTQLRLPPLRHGSQGPVQSRQRAQHARRRKCREESTWPHADDSNMAYDKASSRVPVRNDAGLLRLAGGMFPHTSRRTRLVSAFGGATEGAGYPLPVP